MPKHRWIYLSSLILFFLGKVSYAQEDKKRDQEIQVFHFEVNEYVGVDIKLNFKEERIPTYYEAHLETDVCSDELCKPVSITIRWDMVGQFMSYHTAEQNPLTKFDHILLTEKDHERLHQILSDTSSILRDYEVEDMIDTSKYISSQEVDAVTRPTSLTFSSETVEGALYTVYTLWHFINGPLRQELREYTASLIVQDDSVLRSMLTSENREYVSYAFKISTKDQQNRLVDVLIDLLGSTDAYIPHFALAQLEDDVIRIPKYQHLLLGYFGQADNTLKNAILDRLSTVSLDGEAMVLLLSAVPHLDEVQAVRTFKLIEDNTVRVTKEAFKELEGLSHHKNKRVAQKAKTVLDKIKNTGSF